MVTKYLFIFLLGGIRPVLSSLLSVDQASWDAFNQDISGRLFDGRPMMSPCFNNYNGQPQRINHTRCMELRRENSPSLYFGGYQNINWAACQSTGDNCTISSFTREDHINPARRCSQGSVPSKYVDVRSIDDVQKSLAFIRENGLQLVIKNTGHDYLGRSSASDALALWTHNYRPPIHLNRSFIPEGCRSPVGDVITFGAGEQFEKIYDFASRQNLRVVGGTGLTVGAAGGWITGGGHSLLSNELGLGVDNVYQIHAILPNGTYVTASRCQNTELFFALRGGGGGTFGIVMDVSMLAHQEKPMEVLSLSLENRDPRIMESFLQMMVDNAERWADEGWGGYFQPGMQTDQPITLFMATSMMDHTQAEGSMKPILDFALHSGTTASQNLTTFAGFGELMQSMETLNTMSLNHHQAAVSMSSRILPRVNFQGTANKHRLVGVLNDIMHTLDQKTNSSLSLPPLLVCLTTPVMYSKHLPDMDRKGGPGYSSVTPAWRDGLWHVIHKRAWVDEVEPSTVADIWKETSQSMNPLRQLTPGGGAYQNEGDAFEPDPIGTFWGKDNYDRLFKFKQEVDPDNIFTVHQGIGWEESDRRYNCYPKLV